MVMLSGDVPVQAVVAKLAMWASSRMSAGSCSSTKVRVGLRFVRDIDGAAIIAQKRGDETNDGVVGFGHKKSARCPHQWFFRITNRLIGIRRQVMELSYAQRGNGGCVEYTTHW
jgi:hypothetical protein